MKDERKGGAFVRPTIRLCGSPCRATCTKIFRRRPARWRSNGSFLERRSAEEMQQCAKSGSDAQTVCRAAAEGAADGAGAAGNCVRPASEEELRAWTKFSTRGKA